MTTFVDTGVLIALLDDGHQFHPWAISQVESAKIAGPIVISDIVYCEFSVGMASREHVDEAVTALGVERFPRNDDALFRAGLAFKKYKGQNSGPKNGVLPDFIIGALAAAIGSPLMTTNAKDFIGYFPEVKIICP